MPIVRASFRALLMMSALMMSAALAGCASSPPPPPATAAAPPSAGIDVWGAERYDGFLVASDKPGHFSIAWIDNSSSGDVYDGTIATDGAFDRDGTFAHTGQEALAFDAADQLSFRSAPGPRLDGIEVAAPSGVIYLDARINQSHVGVTILFGAFQQTWGSVLSWNSGSDPVAFSTE